jgi:diguanylate cyclase (GGDEF)-like protein/PAS domain S-box-containing protein
MEAKMAQDFYRNLVDHLFEGVYCLDVNRTITYWNQGAERLTGYRAEDVVGRSCADNILIHVDQEGRQLCLAETCPAAKSICGGGLHEADVFLHHKDGHRVPVSIRTNCLRDESGKIIGAVEIFSERYDKLALEQQVEELQQLSLLDPLTGVGNRRYGEEQARARLNEFERSTVPFGVLMLDLDHFKAINDTHGHQVGDRVLRMVSRTLATNVRSFDHVSRWGGEEFLVIASNVDLPRLCLMAEKLRLLIQSSVLTDFQPPIRITVSIGAAVVAPGDTLESLVARADKLLYESKTKGRNRVTS